MFDVRTAPRALVCVLLLGILVAPLVAQEARLNGHSTHLKLEDISPKDTVFFLSFAGVEASSKAADDLGLFRLFKEADTQAFLGGLIEKYQQVAAQSPERDLKMWNAAKAALSGRISIAMTGGVTYNGKDSTIPLPAMVAAIDVGSNREHAKMLLDKALQEMQPMLDGFGVTRSSKPFKGVDVQLFKTQLQGMKVTFCTAFLDNLLLFSVNQGPIRKCINFAKNEVSKTLSTNPAFQRCRSKAGGHRLLEVYTGVKPALKRFAFFIPDEIQDQLETLGLDNVGAFYYARAIDDGDTVDTFYVDAPAPRRGLLTLSNGKPVSPESMRMISPDAVVAVAARCDLAKAWDLVFASMNEFMDEEVMAQIKGGISMVEDQIGFRVREDILGTIGDELVVYAAMPRDLRVPKLVASIGIRDTDKAFMLISKLTSQAPFELLEVPFGKHTIRLARPQGGSMGMMVGSPCYCLTGDRLIISPTRTGMEGALRRLDDAQARGIASAANFRETMEGMNWQKASAFWYLDTKRVLTLGYEAAYDVAPGLIPAEIPVNLARMPSLEIFLKHTNSFGGTCYGDSDGIVIRSRMIGIASVLALASAAIDRAPGCLPWAIEQFVGEVQRNFVGAPRAGSSGEDHAEPAGAPAATGIINPSKDPAERARFLRQIEELKAGLEQAPDDGQGHFNLAMSYHQAGKFEPAVKHFKRALALDFNRRTTTYNIACALSLLDQRKSSLDWLKKAIKEGFDSKVHLKQDSDLDNVRKHPGFAALLKTLQ